MYGMQPLGYRIGTNRGNRKSGKVTATSKLHQCFYPYKGGYMKTKLKGARNVKSTFTNMRDPQL